MTNKRVFPTEIQDLIDVAPAPDVLGKELKEIVLGNMRGLSHNQAIWGSTADCGTIACIAGHAILLAGLVPTEFTITRQVPNGEWEGIVGVPGMNNSPTAELAEVAAELLDIAPSEINCLGDYDAFDMYQTQEQVIEFLDNLIDS